MVSRATVYNTLNLFVAKGLLQALVLAEGPTYVTAIGTNVKELIDQQVGEPLEELRLRATIRVLTPIDDAISLAVRDQYEHNPYPRWAKLPLPAEPDSIEGRLAHAVSVAAHGQRHARRL